MIERLRTSCLLAATLLVVVGAARADASMEGAGSSADAPVLSVSELGAADVVMETLSLIGTPYRWAGASPEGGFDCSGLVSYVYRDVLARDLPHSAEALFHHAGGQKIDNPSRLQPGDLVFFHMGRHHRRIDHVAVYIGDGRFVHAPTTGSTVRVDNLSDAFWHAHYRGGVRLIPDHLALNQSDPHS